MNDVLESVTQLIHTANGWSSDQPGDGLALLSLGTTRTLHTEQHREECLTEIDANLNWCQSRGDKSDLDQIAPLRDLRGAVETAGIGVEWISWEDYSRVLDALHKRGELV